MRERWHGKHSSPDYPQINYPHLRGGGGGGGGGGSLKMVNKMGRYECVSAGTVSILHGVMVATL